jgi:hypothetical protein
MHTFVLQLAKMYKAFTKFLCIHRLCLQRRYRVICLAASGLNHYSFQYSLNRFFLIWRAAVKGVGFSNTFFPPDYFTIAYDTTI